MDDLRPIKHLHARAGFGLRFADLQNAKHLTIRKAVKALFKDSETDEPLAVVQGNADLMAVIKGEAEVKKIFVQQQRQQEKELNLAWFKQLYTTEAVLREKMTLFWHNHFACRVNNAAFAQQLNNIQRSNALGNLKELILQVSQSPAMLQFLNNQQNRKNHPNENFARELMELFTIGRGNYTEQDVKESARAFTGWGFDKDGKFVLRPFQHDGGQKTFLGKSGNFSGEDIINILFEQKQTARFICGKLYKYLVNEQPDPEHIEAMAELFFAANYEIRPLLEFVFNADWFYDDKNTGNLIKSPVELAVGLTRQFYISYQRPEVLLDFQRTLGQTLFNPPNVAGWPGGRNWIDSSSLMYRLKIPSIVLDGGLIDFSGKADPEDEAYIAATRYRQNAVNSRVQAQPNWDKFLGDIPKNLSNADIAQFLLEPKPGQNLKKNILQTNEIKALAIEVVSTPEYQLC